MNSTRRKRDRGEAAAGTSSRGRSRARPQSSPSENVNEEAVMAGKSEEADNDADEQPQSSSTPLPEEEQTGQGETPEAMDVDGKEASGVENEIQGVPSPRPTGTREERLKALLLHRRTLLDRMRKCKTAAEIRLGENAKALRKKRPLPLPSSTNESEPKTQSGPDNTSAVSTKEPKVLTDEEEIGEYRELTRLSNQLSRKYRATSDAVPEKRTSVSLRRGSSVGKRMNAALSSLAPGAHTMSLPTSSETGSHIDASRIAGMNPLAQPPAAVGSPSGQLLNIKQSSVSKRIQPVKGETTDGSTSLGTKAAKRSIGRELSKSGGGPRASSSSAFRPRPGPLHLAARASVLPRNELVVPRSKVDYPEAQSLRERRTMIRAKLSSLLRERKRRADERTGAKPVRSALPSSVYDWRPAPTMPSKLPNRRKTHWDYLLEEMRWMASDFVEERKWKESSARTLASSVVTKNLKAPPSSGHPCAKKTKAEFSAECTPVQGKASIDEDVQMMDVDETTTLSTMECGLQEYSHPNTSAIKKVRTSASIMSTMVSEIWDATVEAGAFSKSDEAQRLSLRRFRAIEKSISKESSRADGEPGSAADTQKEEERETSDTPPELRSKALGMKADSHFKEETRGDAHDRISEAVASQTDRIVSGKKAKRGRSKSFDKSVPLTDTEQKAIEFLEFVWSEDSLSGAVLDGRSGSGKTLVTCSLLWRSRKQGAQLLACSPARLIRWTHEFNRFIGIKVRIFGFTCGISSPLREEDLVKSYGPGDVVICEFSSLFPDEGTDQATIDLSSFYSVTLDSRHPLESIASGGRNWQEDSANGASDNLPRTPSDRLVPAQLLSRSWWASILSSLRQGAPRRMFIENHGYLRNFAEYGIRCDVITERQHIEFVAAKSAFVLGPHVFFDNKPTTTQHKVVSWAKHCVKKSREDTEKSRFENVLRHLLATLSPFVHEIDSGEGSSAREKRLVSKWELRPCSVPSTQRQEYEQCCRGMRGALSFGGIEDPTDSLLISEQCTLAADALTRLRKLCMHARLDRVLAKASFRSLTRGGTSGNPVARRISQSVSQRNDDLAVDILNGSAKLRELVGVLRDLGSLHTTPALVEVLQKTDSNTRKPKSQEHRATKIAILATMPQAQLLTSILLNAIGVPHELLLREYSQSEGSHSEMLSPTQRRDEQVEALAWIESQIALSEFNAGVPIVQAASDGSMMLPVGVVRCDVLVTSPMTIGSDYGGLGIESAEVVICLDEDWSGRGENVMDRIAHRCNQTWARSLEAMKSTEAFRKPTDTSFKYQLVRLVCENTCEEKFFSRGSDGNQPAIEIVPRELKWRANVFGGLYLPDIETKSDSHNYDSNMAPGFDAALPGQSILRFRDQSMSTVLCTTNQMQPDLFSGRQMAFLPFISKHADTTKPSFADPEIAAFLLRSLLALENDLPCFDLNGQPRAVSALSTSYLNTIPPMPESLPEYVMARHDLSTISTRALVEKLGKEFGSSQGVSSSSSTGHSSEIRPSGLGISPELVSSDSVDLADAWHKSGLSSKPGDVASALLTYRSPISVIERLDGRDGTVVQPEGSDIMSHGPLLESEAGPSSHVASRTNAFAESFTNCREGRYSMVRDGNQGAEPYIYFPPRFPGILRATKRARLELRHAAELRQGRSIQEDPGPLGSSHISTDSDDVQKRKALDTNRSFERNSKRPRVESGAVKVAVEGTVDGAVALQEASPPGEVTRSGYTAGSVHTPSTTKPDEIERTVEASIVTEDDASRGDNASNLLDFGEDYGLLGIGVLASPEDSVREASLLEVDSLAYSGWRDPFDSSGLGNSHDFSDMLACDADEAEASTTSDYDESRIKSMLLFVTKRMYLQSSVGLSANPLTSSSYSSGIAGLPWGQLTSAASGTATASAPYGAPYGISTGENGGQPSKKGRRRGQDMPANSSSAFRVAAKIQVDSARQKAISMLLGRQGHFGVSLFHSPHFRLASVRIRNKVLFRASQAALNSSNALGSGPGFPLPSEKGTDWSKEASRRRRWTSGVLRMDSSTTHTGENALSKAITELTARQKTFVSPRRVDFGPFQVGFLSSPTGMAGVQRPRPRNGMSLPMGVKVTHQRLDSRQASPWTSEEDRTLTNSVLRLGENWQLVAKAINCLHDSESFRIGWRERRSARQCRDRWDILLASNPDLADKAMKMGNLSTIDLLSSVESPSSRLGDSDDHGSPMEKHLSLLAPLSFISVDETSSDDKEARATADDQAPPSSNQASHARRSFETVRKSASKKQEFPLTIPGVGMGEQKPALVPSHASHAQTIQAIASSASGTRSEMWPLQLLDVTDKKRASRSGTRPISAAGSAVLSHRPSALQPPQQLQRHPPAPQRH